LERLVSQPGARRLLGIVADVRVVVVCILLIGISATVVIDRLQVAAARADDALHTTTRLRVVVERHGQTLLLYELHPNQPLLAFARFTSSGQEARDELDHLAEIAPGLEQEQLAAAYARLQTVAARAAMIGAVGLGDPRGQRSYVEAVVVPAGAAFDDALRQAERAYADRAERSHRIARSGSILLVTVSALTVAALVAGMERMRRANVCSLRRKEARFRALVEHGSDLLTVLDATGRIRYQSDSIVRVLGRAPAKVLGEPFSLLVSAADTSVLADLVARARRAGHGAAESAAVSLRHADGRQLAFEITAANHLASPDIGGILLTSRDVTAQAELTRRLQHQALHDPLTGLPNRQLFRDRLDTAIARAARSGARLGVIFLDLDGFKDVNDRLGHAAGDNVLRMASVRLKSAVRAVDTVARIGGDEFVVLLEDVDDAEIERVASRIRLAIDTPFPIAGDALGMAASMGLALRADPAMTADELLHAADVAMYAEKRAGRQERQLPTMLTR
jgi:diguanylate cyclase (GGDEF)-like protein/PAS domain S-box-containing protein